MKMLKVFLLSYLLVLNNAIVMANSAVEQNSSSSESVESSDNPYEKSDLTLDDLNSAQRETQIMQKEAAKLDDGWVDSTHNVLSKPIARLALRRLGAPGFMISKYMNIRKLLNQRRCTLSQEISFAGSMLITVGDIASYVMKYKSDRDLRKEFKEDKEKIDEYMKEASLTGKKGALNTENAQNVEAEKLDVHMLSLNYLKKHEQATLKYKEFKKKFNYPAKAMHLTANIMNVHEMFAEAGASAAYYSKIEACRLRELRKKVATEQKARAQADAALSGEEAIPTKVDIETAEEQNLAASKESAPWYAKPFIWIGEKLNQAGDWVQERTEPVYSFVKDNRRGENTAQRAEGYAKEELAESNKGVSDPAQMAANSAQAVSNGFDKAASLNYMEEMIVGVVDEVRVKATKDMSSVARALIKEGSRVGTRYAVRAAVKGHEEAIDQFMRSAAGRTSIYAYNIIMTGLDIKNTEDSISYSKNKIRALEELEKKFKDEFSSVESRLNERELMSFRELFVKSLFNLFIDYAYASGTISTDNFKFCLESRDCKKPFSLFTDNVKETLVLLPEDVRKKHIDMVKNSYTINTFMKVANAKASIDSFDQSRVKRETDNLEKQHLQLINELDKRKILKRDKIIKYAEYSIQKDMAWALDLFPENTNLLSKKFASIGGLGANSLGDGAELKSLEKSVAVLEDVAYVKEVKKSNKTNVSVVTENTLLADKEYQQSMDKKFNFQGSLHTKDISIWKAIHTRYIKNYHNLHSLVE